MTEPPGEIEAAEISEDRRKLVLHFTGPLPESYDHGFVIFDNPTADRFEQTRQRLIVAVAFVLLLAVGLLVAILD